MDNQKDFYIKSKFKEDDLISKKADEIFNNFFMGEIKMEEEKVVNINAAKDKKIKMRKFTSLVATLLVIFLGANVYATTQGYENIFFMINTIITGDKVTDRDEILKDRDITISYKTIKINNNLELQVNRLAIENDEAKLYVSFGGSYDSEGETYKCLVYDVTSGKKLVGEYNTKDESEMHWEDQGKIKLTGIKNDTSKLEMEIQNGEKELVATLKIDLENKKIDVINENNMALEKISETELKDVLSLYAGMNSGIDRVDTEKEEKYKENLLTVAVLSICQKEGEGRENGYKLEEISKSIKEFSGEELEIPYSTSILTYDAKTKMYEFEPGCFPITALCLGISDISFEGGIYTVTFEYCCPTEGDFDDGAIETLDRYETTMELKINEQYEYNKYCIENIKTLTIKKVAIGSEDDVEIEYEDNDTNESTNTTTNKNTNTVVNTNTITDKKTNTVVNTNTTTDKNTNIVVNTNTNATTNTVVNNTSTEEDESVVQTIDNYASTMSWTTIYTPGLKAEVPDDWHVEVFDDIYSVGDNNDVIATVVSGVATGYEAGRREIVESNVEITFYMPEFTKAIYLDDYAAYIASCYDGKDTGVRIDKGDMKWAIVQIDDGRLYYCNLDVFPNGEESVGRVVQVSTDNKVNSKFVNIVNWFLASLKCTSF